MTLSATTLWLILAALLGIIELIATTFYLLVLAVAALVAAAAAWFDLALEWQIALFAVIAIIGIVNVTAWDESGTATVQYRGADWQARAEEGEARIAGAYIITRVEGSVLYLKKMS